MAVPEHSGSTSVVASLIETGDPHRQKSVQRIRRILVKMGFDKDDIQTMGRTQAGPDLVLTYNVPKDQQIIGPRTRRNRTIKILIQCKSSNGPIADYTGINGLARVYDSYVRELRADLALLTLEGYSLPESYRKPEAIEKWRKEMKVVYWDDETINRYRTTANALGSPCAMYSFLSDLGFRLRLSRKPIKLPAFQIKQRTGGRKIWVFTIPAGQLLRISYVFRRGSVSPEAYQRLLSSRRTGDIAKYIQKHNSMFVNNIVVAFEEPVKFRGGRLVIPQITCSAWLIDGQHRLYGFAKLPKKPETAVILKEFRLIVAGIRSTRGTQGRLLQAGLFREINEFHQKIERNLLLDLYHYLKVEEEKEAVEKTEIVKRLSRTTPFRGRLRILRSQKGKVTLATIVDYKWFSQIMKRRGKSTFMICKAYFEKVSELFEKEWDDSDEYVLCTNKGVRMLISLLFRILNHLERIGDKPTKAKLGSYLRILKKATEDDTNFFRNSSYTGKALGAGAPDRVSVSMWATRIHDNKPDFLTQAEVKEIFSGDVETLRQLETVLRECLEEGMGQGYFSRLPQDIQDEAVRYRASESKRDPGRSASDPPEWYLSFAHYRLIITSHKRWATCFERIFSERAVIEGKLNELEEIRNRLQHFRPLDSFEKSKLAMYTKDIQGALERYQATVSPPSMSASQKP